MDLTWIFQIVNSPLDVNDCRDNKQNCMLIEKNEKNWTGIVLRDCTLRSYTFQDYETSGSEPFEKGDD